MQTRQLKGTLVSAVGFAVLLATGCSPESTGTGLVTVRLSAARADVTASTAVVTQDVATGGVVGGVTGLTVALDSVQLQSSGSDGWHSTPEGQDLPQDLDLLSLPGTDNPIELGTVQVMSGQCQVRLFVSNVRITFDHEIVAGGQTYAPDTPIEGVVRIPSGGQTGLKVDGDCQVEDVDGQTNVTLAFDVAATEETVVVTGNGQVLLTPVIHLVQQ
jgi:hypothetical protein